MIREFQKTFIRYLDTRNTTCKIYRAVNPPGDVFRTCLRNAVVTHAPKQSQAITTGRIQNVTNKIGGYLYAGYFKVRLLLCRLVDLI